MGGRRKRESEREMTRFFFC